MLTTAANNALAMTVTVPGSIQASASEGDLWLSGMVGNASSGTPLSRSLPG